jgi:coenzyme F420-0:L-glutamate ligase/coenzyme F420-1:gamma-L-glutamate ligase
MIEIIPLTDLGEIKPGDDLPALLAGAIRTQRPAPGAGTVVVVTQKIVSKAENRFLALADVSPSAEAERIAAIVRKEARFVELVLRESVAVLRAVPEVLITRHRLGFVMANAGIDRSNLGAGNADRVLLLPADPDGSARRIRDRLTATFGVPLPVVITDSFGRPWRNGIVNVAIGAAGLPALLDRRGQTDRDGRKLEVTQVALGDMIASAAGLATGEGSEGIPAVLISGMTLDSNDISAAALVRPLKEDLFL